MVRSLIIAGQYRRPTGYGDYIRQIVRDGEGLPTARARLAIDFTWEKSANRLIEILAELYERHARSFESS
jgi:hypothetical protein